MPRIVARAGRPAGGVDPVCEPARVPSPPGVADAAGNNAAWCAAVARTHGIAGTLAADAWTASERTPPLYPDAVTLRPDVDARSLLARIDAGAGASVKDSFATLDLAPHGLSVLFEATWISLTAGTGSLRGDTATLAIVDASTFAAWEVAWRGDGPADLLRPELVDVAGVTVLATAGADGTIVGGAVLFATTDTVVGVSNVFAPRDGIDAAWRGIVAWAAMHRPGAQLVGYEQGDDLAAAWRIGFEPVAPLRVWARDA
jgi:hypothetical protein